MSNKQIFIKAFERHIVDKPPVRVKVDGNFVKTVSGKSGWRTIGHAKAALKHHFSCIFDYEEMDRMFGRRDEKWGAFLEEMIRDGVLEFC